MTSEEGNDRQVGTNSTIMLDDEAVIIAPGTNPHIRQNIQQHLLGNPGKAEQEGRDVRWSNLKSPLGLLVLFGFAYWLIITCIGFAFQFSSNAHEVVATWLFKYSVLSMMIAFTVQCCIVTLLLIRRHKEDKYLRGINLDVTCKFLYSLLLCADLFVHIGVMFLGHTVEQIAFSWCFVGCHLLSLFVLSFQSMNWHKGDRWFCAINFAFEWIDILSQIAVIILYHHFADSEDKGTITKVFWVFTLVQILFWIPPLALGSAKSPAHLAKQVVLLDVVTDVPLVITSLVTGAYTVQFWIFCDLIVKVLLMLRGIVVNICLYLVLPQLTKERRRTSVSMHSQ